MGHKSRSNFVEKEQSVTVMVRTYTATMKETRPLSTASTQLIVKVVISLEAYLEQRVAKTGSLLVTYSATDVDLGTAHLTDHIEKISSRNIL